MSRFAANNPDDYEAAFERLVDRADRLRDEQRDMILDDRPDCDPGDRIRKADAKRDEMIDEPRKLKDEKP